MVEVLTERSFDPPPAEEDLTAFLRRSTAAPHRRLEAALDLLGPSPTRERFRALLEGFHGFHAAWEPSLARRPSFRTFFEDRRRLPQLQRDLQALGADGPTALPLCVEAARLADTEAAALGSAYVMEGSTLGGQVIGRALAGADWLPPGGLHYFDPYGARTGEMWRGFRQWSESHPGAYDRHEVAAGAIRTFQVLHAWLTR